MFEVFGLLAAGFELGGWAYLFSKARRDAINRNLTRKTQVREFKFLDKNLKKAIGANPTEIQRKIGNKIIAGSRFLVMTKAWELIVMGLVDPKSKMKKTGNKIMSQIKKTKFHADAIKSIQ